MKFLFGKTPYELDRSDKLPDDREVALTYVEHWCNHKESTNVDWHRLWRRTWLVGQWYFEMTISFQGNQWNLCSIYFVWTAIKIGVLLFGSCSTVVVCDSYWIRRRAIGSTLKFVGVHPFTRWCSIWRISFRPIWIEFNPRTKSIDVSFYFFK